MPCTARVADYARGTIPTGRKQGNACPVVPLLVYVRRLIKANHGEDTFN